MSASNSIVTVSNGQAVTTTIAIAEGTDTEHASVIKLVRTYLGDLEEFGRVGFEIQPFETAGGTQQREIAELNEQQATLIMTYMRNSDVVRAFKKRLVKAFFALATQQPAQPHPKPAITDKASLKDCLLFAKQVEKSLRMSETSKVRMYQVIAEEHRLPAKALPVYTDETLTRALGDLLKEHGADLTAAKANQILIELGFLEEVERRASGGTTKKFKSITEAGQRFGKNETCPQNPRETQPRWYVSAFPALLTEIAAAQVMKEAA